MSDFDQNLMQNDFYNPFSPYNINKPTVMDIVNNPEKYVNATNFAGVPQIPNPNNETIPKTNFFNKKVPNINRTQPYDCFTIMHNNINKVKKHQAVNNLLAAIGIALGVGLLTGKMTKFPKFNFSKLKLPKMKIPKIKTPKMNIPKWKLPKFDFKNIAKNFSNSKIGKSLAQYTAKAKNFITKKTA